MELKLDLDLHEIGLVPHHHVDRLVGLWGLIQKRLGVRGLPGPARHLRLEVLNGQRLPGLRPRQNPAGAVGTRCVRQWVPEAPDDERLLPIAPGMSPRSPTPALIAPFLVTHSHLPSCSSSSV